MKALYSTPTNDPLTCHLAVTERPDPAINPPQHTVLVRVYAAGISPSESLNALQNTFRSTKPIIPGRDFAGIVQASASAAYAPGTHVYGTSGNVLGFLQDGTSAEYVLVPEALLAPKAASLSFAQAGAVGTPYITALEMLEQTRIVAGRDMVLVLGATGAVGRAAVRMARFMGCRVITASRRDVTDVSHSRDPALAQVSELLGGRGPDVVIDTVGSAALISAAMKIFTPQGRYAICSAGKDGNILGLDMLMLYRQAHAVYGISSIILAPERIGDMLQKLTEMFERGLEGPKEEEFAKISLEQSVDAYKEALDLTGKKHVIIF